MSLDRFLPSSKLAALPVAVLVSVYLVTILAKRWMRIRKQQSQPVAIVSEKTVAIEPLEGFDWRTAKRRQIRAFKPTYHITMGYASW